MTSYTDNCGRKWVLDLTIDEMARVRDSRGYDLVNVVVGDPPPIAALADDLVTVVRIIYSIVQPQADKLRVSEADFLRAHDGEVASAAEAAFWEALADFFQKSGRPHGLAGVRKLRELLPLMRQEAERRIAGINTTDLTGRTSGGLSGSGPGSLESTPVP